MPNLHPAKSLTVIHAGHELTVKGREAWALDNLMSRGSKGVTPIDTPGPRWSHYVFKLRGYGLSIETIDEKHGGPFKGTHARYVLHTPLTLKSIIRAGEQ
jgi:hypothetical protein